MYTVFDDSGVVWCQSDSFSRAVAVGDYLLSLGKRVYIKSDSVRLDSLR